MSTRRRFGSSETHAGRLETYRRALHISLIVNIGLAAAAFLAIGMAFWAASSKPEPRYFATREDGGIIPLVAVKQPFLDTGQVTNFAVEAVTAAMTMDFANWRQDLTDASKYFQKPQGWENFLTALSEAGLLDYIRNNNLVATAVANSATVTRTGIDDEGRYFWVVQLPVKITYQSSSERSVEDLLAEVVISRIPTWKSSRGVGVTRITMRSAR